VVSAARSIRLVAKAAGGARTASAVDDADRPQLALIRGYRDELAPIVTAYGEVEIVIRPTTAMPPASCWPPKPPLPGDWKEVDGWRTLLAYARLVEHKRWVVTRWARAAGGDVRNCVLHLPASLQRGLPLAELKSAADRTGLKVEVAAASGDAPCP
jgi:hypothetical protein